MVEGQLWSKDESCVLVAIFFNNDFSIGDDERPENALMAQTFGRTPAAIDRQWRNIDAIYKGKPLHVGYNIERAVEEYESDQRTTRLEAIEICRENGWEVLIPLIGRIGGDRPSDSEGSGHEVSVVSVEDVPIAAMNIEWSEVERLTTNSVVYREARLTERFRSYLVTAGRVVVRYRITRPELPSLYTDLADATGKVIYEAKGTAERMSVRLALGQILDYGRCFNDMALAILLPSEPLPDLVELLTGHDVGCIVEHRDGVFTDLTSLGRCP